MKLFAGVAGVALALALAGSASAGQLIITNVQVADTITVNVPGYGNPWTTPILMTDSNGQVHVTFCDDLAHDVYVGSGQNLVYTETLVTTDGNGHAISEATSNRMGQLAAIGQRAYAANDITGGVAAQMAIWAVEYGFSTTVGDPGSIYSLDSAIQAAFLHDLTIQDNGKGWAQGIVNYDTHTQGQLLGGVPEPATWGMMLLGMFGLGGLLRRQRQTTAMSSVSA